MWPSLPYASDLDIECDEARTAMLIALVAYQNSGLGQRQDCFLAYAAAEGKYKALKSQAVRQL